MTDKVTVAASLPWRPGQMVCDIFSSFDDPRPSAILTTHFAPQPSPYVLRLQFGGYVKADKYPNGFSKLLFSYDSNGGTSPVELTRIRPYEEDDDTWRVISVYDRLPVLANRGFRVTHWFDLNNSNFGNCYLRAQFIVQTRDEPRDDTKLLSGIEHEVGTDGLCKAVG